MGDSDYSEFSEFSANRQLTKQLLTPKLVRIALMIAAKVCKMNFQVSFFFIVI